MEKKSWFKRMLNGTGNHDTSSHPPFFWNFIAASSFFCVNCTKGCQIHCGKYMCVHKCIEVIYICACVCTHVHTSIHVYKNTNIFICLHLDVYTYICIYLHIFTCMSVNIYVYINILNPCGWKLRGNILNPCGWKLRGMVFIRFAQE